MNSLTTAPAGHREGPPPEAAVSLLRMAVGDEILAVPIADVREILQVAKLTPLPRTPGFVRGVMNLRGAVVPVIDLSVRLGRAPTELGRRSCIVVVQHNPQAEEHMEALGAADAAAHATATGSVAMGLLVDAVFEVFDRNTAEIEAAPDIGTSVATEFLRGMTRSGGQLISVLALQQVLSARSLAEAIEAWQPH